MRTALRHLILLALRTDTQAVLQACIWRTRCLFCRSPLWIHEDGEPLSQATLEHVVPRSWFLKPGARDLIQHLSGPEDPRNLALACPRCNAGKGHGPDAAGPETPRAMDIVKKMQARRMDRWRQA